MAWSGQLSQILIPPVAQVIWMVGVIAVTLVCRRPVIARGSPTLRRTRRLAMRHGVGGAPPELVLQALMVGLLVGTTLSAPATATYPIAQGALVVLSLLLTCAELSRWIWSVAAYKEAVTSS